MISIVVISKNEPALAATLAAIQAEQRATTSHVSVLVVDASAGALSHIRDAFKEVRWIDYVPAKTTQVTIPHQRNIGVRAAPNDIVVFIDSGCVPRSGWLTTLVTPIMLGNEMVTAGTTVSIGRPSVYDKDALGRASELTYLEECPTINMAFSRQAFDSVGGFDEGFQYGSDVDFAWRLRDAGFRIRLVPEAMVEHAWGSWRRQLRRSYLYGRARCRLYTKHVSRRRSILSHDPIAVVYPAFILGLPLMRRLPWYPLLLLIPITRNRANGGVRTVVDHLAYGWGVLAELAMSVRR